MITLCPDGNGVNLSYVRTITTISNTYDNNSNVNGYKFSLYYNGLTCDNTKFTFDYRFNDYADSREELKIKIENIRREIMKRMNGGVDVKQILSGINLKKK